MKIQWIGGTTFLLKNSTGKRVLLDPIKLNLNINKYDYNANIITLSRTDRIDSIKDVVSNDCKIFNSVCTFNNEFIKLKSYATFKDNVNGMKRGDNLIYLLEIDDLKICHLGTIGHKLNADFLCNFKNIDFLFVPIGGHFCFNGVDAAKLAYSIDSKYIIPMYYKTASQYLYLDGPQKFLSSMKNIISFKDSSIQTNNLSSEKSNNTVLFLNSFQ